jgi:two-component system, NarL family, nitrate/nitrite response regulator NarL
MSLQPAGRHDAATTAAVHAQALATPIVVASDVVDHAIRVLIVADVRLYREGLQQVLAHGAQLHVVGGVGRTHDLTSHVTATSPDVIVLDMSGPNALATATALLAELPDVRILGLGVSDTDDDAVTCLEAGLAGYVPHAASVDELYAAIRSVVHGELLCSPRVAGTLRRHLASLSIGRGASAGERELTSRERQIVRLLARGLTNKEIARELIIEVATVKNHVHNILDKLHVRRRSDAVARLHDIRLGGVPTDFARGI